MSTAKKSERRTHVREIPVSHSITAPAVRTVVVQIADMEDEPPEAEDAERLAPAVERVREYAKAYADDHLARGPKRETKPTN